MKKIKKVKKVKQFSKIPVTYSDSEYSRLNYAEYDPINFEYRRASVKWKRRQTEFLRLMEEFNKLKNKIKDNHE